jgi:lipopolysaccharide heptosyltransferase II
MPAPKDKKIDKILIIKPSSLGDIFHCFPAAALLHEAYPDARIDWFIRPEFEEALSYCPVKITKAIHFPRRQLGKVKSFLPAFVKTVNNLRKEKYSLIVDFQGLLRSAVFTSLARSAQSAGFALPREPAASLAYSRKIHIPEGKVHAVDRYIALAETVCDMKVPDTLPELPEIDEFKKSISKLLEKNNVKPDDKLIGIIPGARWESKRWPPEFFAKISDGILKANPDYKILIIGSPDDRDSGQTIISKAIENKRIVSVAGDTGIGEMIEAIHRCAFIFSNDSGPIHIAAALQKPVFALFGPTDPDKTGPYGDIHHIFQRDLKCIKCLKKSCPKNNYECHNLDISQLVSKLNDYIKSI